MTTNSTAPSQSHSRDPSYSPSSSSFGRSLSLNSSSFAESLTASDPQSPELQQSRDPPVASSTTPLADLTRLHNNQPALPPRNSEHPITLLDSTSTDTAAAPTDSPPETTPLHAAATKNAALLRLGNPVPNALLPLPPPHPNQATAQILTPSAAPIANLTITSVSPKRKASTTTTLPSPTSEAPNKVQRLFASVRSAIVSGDASDAKIDNADDSPTSIYASANQDEATSDDDTASQGNAETCCITQCNFRMHAEPDETNPDHRAIESLSKMICKLKEKSIGHLHLWKPYCQHPPITCARDIPQD